MPGLTLSTSLRPQNPATIWGEIIGSAMGDGLRQIDSPTGRQLLEIYFRYQKLRNYYEENIYLHITRWTNHYFLSIFVIIFWNYLV